MFFKNSQSNAFFDSRVILKGVLLATLTAVSIGYVGVTTASAQLQGVDDFESEDLVLAVVVDRRPISAGMFAIQQNGRFYLPVGQLSEILSFNIDVDLNQRIASGWILDEDRSFEVDANKNELTYRNNRVALPDGAVLDNSIAGDDLYVLKEVLDEIWPLAMDVDVSTLALVVTPDEDLPFQKLFERKQRQERMLANRAKKDIEADAEYPFVVYPYHLFGKPSVDVQLRAGYDAQQDNTISNIAVNGVQDFLYASADYSASLGYSDSEIIKPRNLRLRFRRQDIHKGALPFGLKDVQYGDVNLGNRRLIDNSIRGRGALFTTSTDQYSNEFDLITIDGVGIPGYEVELYINNQLFAFTDVNESGVYQFDDVQITYGNNRIRTVLYGPQGQVEEKTENYFYNASMVQPGKTRFSGGIIDAREDLISIDERVENRPTGLAGNLYGAYGLSERMTVFGSATINPGFELSGRDLISREYVSAGAIATFPTTLAQAEVYKQLDGGGAVDVRTVSDFKGFKVSLRGALFSDFESPESTLGSLKKDYELEANIRRGLVTPIGNIGLELGGDYVEREDGTSRSTVISRQSLGLLGTRLSNRTRTNLNDSSHVNTNADFSTTTRLNKWRLRNSLNYKIYPDLDVTSISTNLRYGSRNEFSTAFGLQRNFDSNDTRATVQVSKDFEKFLASIEASASSKNGVGVLMRASTSFGPYAQDGSYLMQSDPLRSSGPISAFVYQDENYDGIFNEGDKPVSDAKMKIGRRITKDDTDESGYLARMNTSYVGRRINVTVDRGSIDDPYLITTEPGGYEVFPRPGVKQSLTFPLINTGAIDGTIRWANDARPIAGLDLQLMDSDGNIAKESTTAQDGYYTFERIPPGSYTIRANPISGLNIPFEYVELTKDDLFKFGIDIDTIDLNRPMMVDLDVGLDKDGSLNAKNILSVAKGFKSQGKGLSASTQPRAKIQKAVQRNKSAAPQPSMNKTPSSYVANNMAAPSKIEMSVLDKIAARINQPDAPVGIQQVSVSETQESARLTVELSAPVEYSLGFDPNSNSIFLEMPYAKWDAQKTWQSANNMILNSYNAETTGSTGVRVILNVAEGVEIGAAGLLSADGFENDRLYIDVVKK